MFGDLNVAVQWIAAFLVLCTLIGVAIVLVRGSYTKARMEALRTSLTDVDAELNRERDRRKRLEDRVTHVERENETLREMVLQRAEYDQILEAVKTHQTESVGHWNSMHAAMKDYYEKIVSNQAIMIAGLQDLREKLEEGSDDSH